jgi:mRNA interferase RelE/StbE
MKVIYRRNPIKALRRMQRAEAADITGTIQRVAADPWAPNNNLTPLKGVLNGFRLRVGDWRVSYTVDRGAAVIEVFEISPRGGAYR